MFTLFVLAMIIVGLCCAALINMIKQTRAEMVDLKRQIGRLEARLDGITERDAH